MMKRIEISMETLTQIEFKCDDELSVRGIRNTSAYISGRRLTKSEMIRFLVLYHGDNTLEKELRRVDWYGIVSLLRTIVIIEKGETV